MSLTGRGTGLSVDGIKELSNSMEADGHSRDEISDVLGIAMVAAEKYAELSLKSDDIALHREDDFYGTGSTEVQDTMKVIEELGKVAKAIKEMAQRAKEEYVEVREHLNKKAPLKNEIAELEQKVTRAMGKSELTLKLLQEKTQGVQEINERIDGLENRVRGGATVGSTVAEERTKKAQADYTPSFNLDHYDTQQRRQPDLFEYYEGKVVQGMGGGRLAGCIEVGPVGG